MYPHNKANIAVILNGISLQRRYFYKKWLPVVSNHFNVDVFETLTKNDGIVLSSKAIEKFKYKAILAAGGDGTLHQVVNGIIAGRETASRLPAIGLVPLGSGNDFAKSVGVDKDPNTTIDLLLKFTPEKINVGKISFTDFYDSYRTRYFINVADIGMGPEVVRRVNDSGRTFGSIVAYYKSIMQTFFSYEPMVVEAIADDWEWKGELRTLAIANGKYYGHGLCIAPDADLSDNLFTAFICGNVSVMDFIMHSQKLRQAKFVRMHHVQYNHCKSIRLKSDSLCLIEGDGEILGKLPAKIELVDRKIDFLK